MARNRTCARAHACTHTHTHTHTYTHTCTRKHAHERAHTRARASHAMLASALFWLMPHVTAVAPHACAGVHPGRAVNVPLPGVERSRDDCRARHAAAAARELSCGAVCHQGKRVSSPPFSLNLCSRPTTPHAGCACPVAWQGALSLQHLRGAHRKLRVCESVPSNTMDASSLTQPHAHSACALTTGSCLLMHPGTWRRLHIKVWPAPSALAVAVCAAGAVPPDGLHPQRGHSQVLVQEDGPAARDPARLRARGEQSSKAWTCLAEGLAGAENSAC